MDGSGVGATRLNDISLGGNALLLGQLHQKVYHFGVADYRAVHHLHRRPLPRQTAGGVLGTGNAVLTGDIHGDAIVRVNGPCGGFGSSQTHFLLGGEDKVHIVGTVMQPLHGL